MNTELTMSFYALIPVFFREVSREKHQGDQ